jgi:arylsulfatase A-like enzyme
VSYVTINHQGWDTHKKHFQAMNQKLPELDRGVSSLLQDLHERGLLDSTIVWVSGEFGRTPKIQWEAPWDGGRGHYGKAFSALVAGGGFRGGTVVGKTDERGETVIERPIYPWDLLGSMMELLGIDPAAKLVTTQGVEVTVSPLAGNEIPAKETGGLLREIT